MRVVATRVVRMVLHVRGTRMVEGLSLKRLERVDAKECAAAALAHVRATIAERGHVLAAWGPRDGPFISGAEDFVEVAGALLLSLQLHGNLLRELTWLVVGVIDGLNVRLHDCC